jgi:hypothetical protein
MGNTNPKTLYKDYNPTNGGKASKWLQQRPAYFRGCKRYRSRAGRDGSLTVTMLAELLRTNGLTFTPRGRFIENKGDTQPRR